MQKPENIVWEKDYLSRPDFEDLLGQKGCVLWFTGLSGSGKSTLAKATQKALHQLGRYAIVLDGDNIRHGLNKNLTFSEEDRNENIRRVSEVCKLLVNHGAIVITAFISPFRQDRINAKAVIGQESFKEVFVSTPLAVCIERDVKGLYAKAQRGEIKNFTGISQPYEEPLMPALSINTSEEHLEASVGRIVGLVSGS
ncbi:adenylyl-sulfate kinase [Jiulongibacter sediminis]|uniref:Adenylyl-sulfate kinase n=1 Tax=Jiulongibacter sediminis TaxID=1605367 RepID=A0A0P7BV20_9BACT|nr:adenylyl-sulfate kinase [Jiulongibacter sediminis]KPM48545.1 adenylylsulfate kinase [Jiulongibacter sediminis]TBX25084.1 adenylylsulfate kinase [Jiulongibacter sediminis]